MSGWGAIFNTTQDALRIQSQALIRLQEITASGQRINRPSDDPVDAFKVLQFRNESQLLGTYTTNLGTVTDSINQASTVLQAISNALTRVRTLANQAASGTYNASNRQPLGREVDTILDQVVSLANTKSNGRYLFGGGDSSQPPFVAVKENGTTVRVDYQGGDNPLPVPVESGVQYGTVLVGDTTFQSHNRQAPVFMGHTGATSGAGTSNVSGDAWLTVAHTATTYQGASGIAAGDSSATADTILGTHHTLTVDAVAQTVQLDDGQAVHYDGTETDLKLTSAAGAAATVNVTGIAPGFQGTVGIQATGTMSLDDGLTHTDIGLTATDAVTDSRTGKVLYVNTTNISQTGLEPVNVPGTFDLFSALVDVRDAILNSRSLSDADQSAAMDQALGALQEATANVTQALTFTGAQLEAMSGLVDNLNNLKASSDQQADTLSNADIVDISTELARQQTLYQMTLASMAKLLSLSILDYM